ncbi:hypothetical protein ACRRTK_009834 [Alexandromys fortis]
MWKVQKVLMDHFLQLTSQQVQSLSLEEQQSAQASWKRTKRIGFFTSRWSASYGLRLQRNWSSKNLSPARTLELTLKPDSKPCHLSNPVPDWVVLKLPLLATSCPDVVLAS